MSKPTPHDLTIADEALVAALAAVGDVLPLYLRQGLVSASEWCWLRRVDLHNAELDERVNAEAALLQHVA